MRSEEDVVQGVKNIAKIGMADVEKDKFTTIDDDVQFEIPSTEVQF